jgi:flagellar motor switch protein FliN/FliY
MSTAAGPSLSAEVQGYAQAWAKSIAGRDSTSKTVCEIVLQPANAAAPSDADLWIALTYAGRFAGQVTFRVDPLCARWLLRPTSAKAPEISTDLTSEDKAALLVTLRDLAQSVSGQLPWLAGVEFQIDYCTGHPEGSATVIYLQVQPATGQPILLELGLDGTILGNLQSVEPETGAAVQAGSVQTASERLEMLMDVELSATLRFGGKQMLLRDILELCAGSVVELDQEVQEPVGLLLDGRLIARGEVVVVDGNYGFKVTEVLANAHG